MGSNSALRVHEEGRELTAGQTPVCSVRPRPAAASHLPHHHVFILAHLHSEGKSLWSRALCWSPDRFTDDEERWGNALSLKSAAERGQSSAAWGWSGD